MRCTAFRAPERATLRGFATLVHENGLVLLDCPLHEKTCERWVSPPSRPMLDKDRKLIVGDDGKLAYAPVVEFTDKKIRFKWSAAAVAAIDDDLKSSEPTAAVGRRVEQQANALQGARRAEE